MNVDPGFQLDLLGALRRRMKMILTVVGASVLTAYWIAMALPNYYDSAATIFVEPQAINQKLVESGDAASIGYRLSLMSAQILSRPQLSRVIDDLGLYPEESLEMLREDVINLLRSRINVLPVETPMIVSARGDDPGLSTFVVSFTHKNPEIAASVAQRLANDFVKEHIEERVGMTRKSLDFIETELARLNEDYASVQEKITQVKNANVGSLPDDLATNQRILDRIMTDQRQGERLLDAARSDKSFWDTQIMSAAAFSDPRDDASPLLRLSALELSLSEYRARGFTDRHPDVIQAEQEVAEVRSQIDSTGGDAPRERPPTLAQQNAEAQRERAALEVELAAKELARVRISAEILEQRLAETPAIAEQLGQLGGQLSRLSGNVQLFSRRQLQAKVQVDVERRQLGEQFNILEPAFAATTPSSPNRVLIMLMGLVAGLAIGVSAAVLSEATDSSFRASRDVQTAFAIPVLAAIPKIVFESDRVATRRKLIGQLIAAGGIAFFCLMGGWVTYVYVNGMPPWLRSVVEDEEPSEVAPAAEAEIRFPLDLG